MVEATEHIIKPSKEPARLDTSEWPLLLKVNTSHHTLSLSPIKYFVTYIFTSFKMR